MLPYAILSKVAITAVSGVLVASGGFMLYNHIWDKGYDQAQAEYREKERIALLEYAKKIVEGGQQHEKDARTIRKLRDDARRVRVIFPTCPDTTSGAENPDGGGGVLSERVDDAFAGFQEEVSRLIERCDELNIDAIRMNSQAGG